MEEFQKICSNPWCKAPFTYTEKDMTLVKKDDIRENKISNQDSSKKTPPKECPKCKSFNSELSGGVEWKDKIYEGPRVDGRPHEIKYKVTNYK